jgi:hypothetical protein
LMTDELKEDKYCPTALASLDGGYGGKAKFCAFAPRWIVRFWQIGP